MNPVSLLPHLVCENHQQKATSVINFEKLKYLPLLKSLVPE
jgi:hypothetical protein